MFHYIEQGLFYKSVSLQMSSLETGGVFLMKILQMCIQDPTKLDILHISRTNRDHEWIRMINGFILCDLFENSRKIMQQTEKEALSLDNIQG